MASSGHHVGDRGDADLVNTGLVSTGLVSTGPPVTRRWVHGMCGVGVWCGCGCVVLVVSGNQMRREVDDNDRS